MIVNRIRSFFRNETVLAVSAAAACLSAVFVPPSSKYIGYIDFKVLALLFSLMAVVAGLRKIGTFEVLAHELLKKSSSVKGVSLVLVLVSFFLAMFVTNDVALITMVPFTIAVLDFISEKRLIFVIVMETAAANMGSMLTPIGNPQNLYLFSYYGLSAGRFMALTLPICMISLILIMALTLTVKGQRINIVFDVDANITSSKAFASYAVLFLLCLLTVLNLADYRFTLAVVVVVIFTTDRSLFKEIDYCLLLTFVAFFIFVGNVGQLESVSDIMYDLLDGRELYASALISQVISNVPAAVMLSGFTEDYKALILGTDIGGLGTLIASLASLISFKIYSKRREADKKLYLITFTVINAALLVLLLFIANRMFLV